MPSWAVTAEAILVGLAFAVVLGLLLELLVFRWVRNRPQIVKAVITIGVLLALQSTASLIWKNNQYHLPILSLASLTVYRDLRIPPRLARVLFLVVAPVRVLTPRRALGLRGGGAVRPPAASAWGGRAALLGYWHGSSAAHAAFALFSRT